MDLRTCELRCEGSFFEILLHGVRSIKPPLEIPDLWFVPEDGSLIVIIARVGQSTFLDVFETLEMTLSVLYCGYGGEKPSDELGCFADCPGCPSGRVSNCFLNKRGANLGLFLGWQLDGHRARADDKAEVGDGLRGFRYALVTV